MNTSLRTLAAPFAAFTLIGPNAAAQDERPDYIGHKRHHHVHNPKHETVPADAKRFITSRQGAPLDLPAEDDAFFFVVFGDRTGGPDTGVSVLADAVHDTNLLEPDLVMTVGDLIDGYNQTDEWMAEMREYKGIMDKLICPWFPVAGNHDIYWRGPNRPEGEHEKSYEMHFGPLWYAFEHKNCWFIALYSDEGDPRTGEKSINKPETQVMSEEQLTWLTETLSKAQDADHVFVFLHHPRWIGGNYGDDWDKVHDVLVGAGNVSAVFAGHIHRMRYDPKDGIEYVTLATVGGGQSEAVPEAGYLHHYNIVTVRKDQIALSSIPVGEIMDVREITGELSSQAYRLSQEAPKFAGELRMEQSGAADSTVQTTITNPISKPVEVTLAVDSGDSRWRFLPDHNHAVLEPGETREFAFHAFRSSAGIDETFRPVELHMSSDILDKGFRYTVPTKTVMLPLDAELPAPPIPATERALTVDGQGAHARIASSEFTLPDGPMTIECWFNADSYSGRTGLVTKTENSDYGIFVSNGQPGFSIFLGNRYTDVRADGPILETGVWHHVAGVYDGAESRLYVDGKLIASDTRAAPRRTNDLPLILGGDVAGGGRAMSFFDGQIDAFRLSSTARYSGPRFTPQRRFESDEGTVLLLNMDGAIGPWIYDESGNHTHPVLQGATVAEAK
jgi:hypothetical protein